jgi:DUF1680 family protein
MTISWFSLVLFGSSLPAEQSATAVVADYPLKPVPFNEVELTGDFWRPRLVTQRETLVPFAFERTQSGVAHLQAAADALAGKKVEGHRAHRFIDSDLYKVMEGAAYLVQLKPDPKLEAQFDAIVDVIAAAQEENGYLYPSHTTGVGSTKSMMGDKPYEFVVHSHELYNMGHMYEAAVAYFQATGKRKLLDVAEQNAAHVNRVFFEGDGEYNDGEPVRQAPGHQEIELALVKLYRVTGKQMYLDMARKFLEIRGVTFVPDGEGVMAPTYAQQHAPVADQTEAVGHAVRATYLYAGMADVGTLTEEPAYAKALERIWGDIVNTRMHITGGLGAVHGIEGFGPQYELPNHHAFNETCAAVGNVFFNFRMFLLQKDAKYLDVAEAALLNNVLAAVNLDGNRFFYVNPLESDGKYPFNHGTAARAPWFGTACCPSNLARLVPQVPGMTYASDENDLYVTFFAASRTKVDFQGVTVGVEQETDYPNSGLIKVALNPERPVRFQLKLRIPTWSQDRFVPGELYHYIDKSDATFALTVNGESLDATVKNGFAVIDREWQPGDRVQLDLPMPVRLSECHPSVEANRGRVAVTRGPLVMCAEGVDNDGATQRFFLADAPATDAATTSQLSTAGGSFQQVKIPAQAVTADGESESRQLTLTPYYAWNNRGVSTMTVWFPREAALAEFDPAALTEESDFASVTASHTYDEDAVSAVGDQGEPRWSSGNKSTRWSSRPQRGKPQWVEAEFHKTKTLRSVGVYWFANQEDVKVPKEWSIEVRQNDAWVPFELYVTDEYGVAVNQYNVVRPAAPLDCDAIRLLMTPEPDQCVGVLEIDVTFEDAGK